MANKEKWYTHYPKEIPISIPYDKKPLHVFLKENADQYPDKNAIHFMGKEISFSEVYKEAIKITNYMQLLGLKKGDRVAIMLPNCPQAVISYYAVLMAGAIVVQTNPLYKERELEYQLNDSGSTLIICLDILFPLVMNVRKKTSIKHTIVTSVKDYLPFPKNLIYPFIQKKQYNLVVKVKQSNDTHVWQSVIDETPTKYRKVNIDPMEEIALIQYTGGTTGQPKGVMLTHFNLVANVQMCAAWLYKTELTTEIVLGVLPFFHVYGMTTVMNLSIMQGSKMVLLPKFDANAVLKTIHKQRPTLFPGAPTIYVGLLNHPNFKKYDLSSIKACISGSAPLPIEVQEQFEKATGGKLVEGYGLTEAAPVTHANFLWAEKNYGSVGVPWPNTQSKIINLETQEEVDIGEVGEIVIKGPQVMRGYWNNPEETKKVFNDGWLYTGDLGYMDHEGFFYIVDRKGDMIIAGGYNIYPRDVEEVLYEHEGVQEAVVIGIPDTYRGETVKAFVVKRPGINLTEETLESFCRERLAAYKVPKLYEFREELPKTAIGKIIRHQLLREEK